MRPHANKPSLVEQGALRFVIMDAPHDSNIELYIKELAKYKVRHSTLSPRSAVRVSACGLSVPPPLLTSVRLSISR